MTEASAWWWFTFADAKSFSGSAIVQGNSFAEAHDQTFALGCNIGGDVLASQIAAADERLIPLVYRNRLLNGDEVKRILGILNTLGPPRPYVSA